MHWLCKNELVVNKLRIYCIAMQELEQNMSDYKYKISVVTSLDNVANYLDEEMESNVC